MQKQKERGIDQHWFKIAIVVHTSAVLVSPFTSPTFSWRAPTLARRGITLPLASRLDSGVTVGSPHLHSTRS